MKVRSNCGGGGGDFTVTLIHSAVQKKKSLQIPVSPLTCVPPHPDTHPSEQNERRSVFRRAAAVPSLVQEQRQKTFGDDRQSDRSTCLITLEGINNRRHSVKDYYSVMGGVTGTVSTTRQGDTVGNVPTISF